MLSNIRTISLNGLDGYIINVQVDVSSGMPTWEVVGLAGACIKESKERIRIAIKNSGYKLNSRKIVINLAPANIRKEGSFLDLPISIGLLMSAGIIKKLNLSDYILIGELSLNGSLNSVKGVLPMCIEAQKLGIKNIILPKGNLEEANMVDGIHAYGAEKLEDVVNFFNYGELLCENVKNKNRNLFKFNIDFSDVRGQENAKRALEIACSGWHNSLMIGSPGVGKTMLAKRIPTILPELSNDEIMEVTKVHSLAGKLSKNNPLIINRPFVSPHHTISLPSFIGGGRIPVPGEISLAHLGVLFLDEFPEFDRRILEVLREPLEEKKIVINRVNSKVEYPCDFMLVAAMNPCPCGYWESNVKKCKCTNNEIVKYRNKISGPLLDRIDIQIEVPHIEYKKINDNCLEKSEIIRNRVNKARKIQRLRYKDEGIFFNSQLSMEQIKKYCNIDQNSEDFLERAYQKFNLSLRSYSKILKVARTIADLDESVDIKLKHVIEAVKLNTALK